MTPKERDEELEALNDEIRYLRRERNKFRTMSEELVKRARDVVHPKVEVRKVGEYHRIYVNDAYIDGKETAEVAATLAERLRKAFASPVE